MRFEGEFRVPGQPADVLRRFADVERMASCMPGASIEGRDEEGTHLGVMQVAFGPKRIRFRGKVRCDVDHAALTGALHVRGAAELRSRAPVEVRVTYALRQDATTSSPMTVVAITSDGEMGGVLADFAHTGGVAVTRALMEEFAARAAQAFAHEAQARAPDAPQPSTAVAAPGASSPSAALPAHRLLWRALRHGLASFFGRVKPGR